MGWFEAVLMIASFAISAMEQSGANNGMPELPGYTPPDYEPLIEQQAFTTYQDKTRNKLLSDFYGGKQVNGRTTFGGTKPSERYSKEQMGTIESSAANFSPDLAQYYAERGIAPGDQVEGAQGELNKGYDQRAREIAAKTHDIYALTLGSLLGEVGDAGAQSARATGMVGQANQMENNRRDQEYNQAMQKWQFDKSQPTTAGTIGSMLPYLGMMFNSAGSNTDLYDAGSGGSGFNPGMSNNSYINYNTMYGGK